MSSFGSSLHPYIEIRAFVETIAGEREVGLLPFLANAAIADVGHNSYDLDVGFDVKARSHSNPYAQRTVRAHVSLHERLIHNRQALAALAPRPRVVLVT